jgi:hypothetical protein
MHASITIHIDWMCLGAENNSTLITRTVETLEHTAITDVRDFRYSCQHIHFWSLYRVFRQLRPRHTKRFATSYTALLPYLRGQSVCYRPYGGVFRCTGGGLLPKKSVFLMSLEV